MDIENYKSRIKAEYKYAIKEHGEDVSATALGSKVSEEGFTRYIDNEIEVMIGTTDTFWDYLDYLESMDEIQDEVEKE